MSALPAPSGTRRDPREITYEWELTSDDGTRERVVLRITHQPAGIDVDVGQRLPSRFEAEITNQTQLPSVTESKDREIPFTGLRICWEQTSRFSRKGMEAFADTALSRLAGLYLAGDTRVAPYFRVPGHP